MLNQLTPEHAALRATTKRFIAEKVNPFVDQWEADEIFPAHQVFKGMGDLGLLGLDKPVENGGSGLDYSYAAVFAEALADINCGGIPMATGVQTLPAHKGLCPGWASRHAWSESPERQLVRVAQRHAVP